MNMTKRKKTITAPRRSDRRVHRNAVAEGLPAKSGHLRADVLRVMMITRMTTIDRRDDQPAVAEGLRDVNHREEAEGRLVEVADPWFLTQGISNQVRLED